MGIIKWQKISRLQREVIFKYAFHRRKVVWDTVGQMVRCGWNAAEACNKIYTVYGQQSNITIIINQMRKDRKNGGNPALRTLNIEHV